MLWTYLGLTRVLKAIFHQWEYIYSPSQSLFGSFQFSFSYSAFRFSGV